jgi:preprotein translocase subunit YajC
MLATIAFAQAAEGAQAPGGGAFSSIIMMVVIFAIFYFILIRPQQKKMKEHKKMIEEVKKGDRIVTSGGIYGVVEGVAPNTLTVKIAEGVKVKITRSSVGAVVTEEEAGKE